MICHYMQLKRSCHIRITPSSPISQPRRTEELLWYLHIVTAQAPRYDSCDEDPFPPKVQNCIHKVHKVHSLYAGASAYIHVCMFACICVGGVVVYVSKCGSFESITEITVANFLCWVVIIRRLPHYLSHWYMSKGTSPRESNVRKFFHAHCSRCDCIL